MYLELMLCNKFYLFPSYGLQRVLKRAGLLDNFYTSASTQNVTKRSIFNFLKVQIELYNLNI